MAEHLEKYFVSTSFIAATVLSLQSISFVVADASQNDDDDSNQTDDDKCDDCDDDDESDGKATEIGVLAVVGVFILTLLLLFMCYLRVRFMARRTKERRRVQRQIGSGRGSGNRVSAERSVFALNVPSQTMGQLLAAITSLRSSTSMNVPLGEVIIQPPPYSERDPITPPVPEYVEVVNTENTTIAELPPPYSSCVKEERNEEICQTGGGEQNGTRDEHEHTNGDGTLSTTFTAAAVSVGTDPRIQ